MKNTHQNFYTSAINSLTLESALEQHYELNPIFTRWNDYTTQLQQETMKSHDIMHIVFGCDTSLKGEFRVEITTFFCVNLTLKEYYAMVSNNEISKEPFDILKKLGFWKVFSTMTLHIWYIPYCLYLSLRMKKKWPVLETEAFMQRTIGELREEYGIIVKKSKIKSV
jgi:ubiquinone biosynthesis protein Coq4